MGWWWWWETDLSLSQILECLIAHDERDAGFGVRGTFVDFGLVLYVDCPGCLDTFFVLDLELKDRVRLEERNTPTSDVSMWNEMATVKDGAVQ